MGAHQFGLLGGVVASVEYRRTSTRPPRAIAGPRLAGSLRSAGAHPRRAVRVSGAFAAVDAPVIRHPRGPHPRAQLRGHERRPTSGPAAGGQRHPGDAERRIPRAGSHRCFDDIGGAVTIGLAHYTTAYEVDQLMRALASLG